MPAVLARDLLKAFGLISTFAATLAITAVVLVRAARWFLQAEGALIPRETSRFAIVSRGFSELARRKALAVLVVGVACLLIHGALLPLLKIPAPRDHDEFSYLLAADTLAHGRLTNPTRPMWVHLRKHAHQPINQRPTYMSMYPPRQGMVLAVGQWLGHPWLGIWFTTALRCALICWMLQAWLPPKWALVGGVLAILQFGILSYWMNTYFCASLPALAGALVLGALPRLKKRPQAWQAVLLAIGVSLLAITRPYEGLIFSLPVAGALLAWMLGKDRPSARTSWLRVIVSMASTLVISAGWLGYYNWRVSGNPLVMPYQINRQT